MRLQSARKYLQATSIHLLQDLPTTYLSLEQPRESYSLHLD
jgi:hypothetical protein